MTQTIDTGERPGLEYPMQPVNLPIVRELGLTDYIPVWRRMARFAAAAGPETGEEIWLLSHQPVFTLGQAAKPEHLLSPGEIPVIQTDRGGQVTYHGPGQLVVYPLLNLRRREMGIRDLVNLIEMAVIDSLAEAGISASRSRGAPGVYVEGAKIAALGLRIKRGWSYHGLSLNVDMDLTPFKAINPCGYEGLQVVQVADLAGPRPGLMQSMVESLTEHLLSHLNQFPLRQVRRDREPIHA